MRRRDVLVALAAAGCAPGGMPPGIPVAPGVSMRLPPPGSLGRAIEAAQMVDAVYGTRHFAFEAHLSVQPGRVLVVGLDPMGGALLRAEWSGDGVKATASPVLPPQFRAENMLAVLVLLYWPADVVRQALAAGELIEQPGLRVVRNGPAEVIRAEYAGADPWNGTVRYRNPGWQYGLDIQSVVVGG